MTFIHLFVHHIHVHTPTHRHRHKHQYPQMHPRTHGRHDVTTADDNDMTATIQHPLLAWTSCVFSTLNAAISVASPEAAVSIQQVGTFWSTCAILLQFLGFLFATVLRGNLVSHHQSSHVLELAFRGHLLAHEMIKGRQIEQTRSHMTSRRRAQIGLKATTFNALVEVCTWSLAWVPSRVGGSFSCGSLLLEIRDQQTSGGTSKGSKSCEPLGRYSTDLRAIICCSADCEHCATISVSETLMPSPRKKSSPSRGRGEL